MKKIFFTATAALLCFSIVTSANDLIISEKGFFSGETEIYKISEGDVTGAAKITGPQGKEISVVVAAYEGNRLSGIAFEKYALTGGEDNVSATVNLKSPTKESTAKLMLWDSLFNPISPAEEISAKSPLTDIGTLSVVENGMLYKSVKDEENHTVRLEVPAGIDLTKLNPVISDTDAAVTPKNGTADFTDSVTYTVTSEDGKNTQDWVVTAVPMHTADSYDFEDSSILNTDYASENAVTLFENFKSAGDTAIATTMLGAPFSASDAKTAEDTEKGYWFVTSTPDPTLSFSDAAAISVETGKSKYLRYTRKTEGAYIPMVSRMFPQVYDFGSGTQERLPMRFKEISIERDINFSKRQQAFTERFGCYNSLCFSAISGNYTEYELAVKNPSNSSESDKLPVKLNFNTWYNIKTVIKADNPDDLASSSYKTYTYINGKLVHTSGIIDSRKRLADPSNFIKSESLQGGWYSLFPSERKDSQFDVDNLRLNIVK